MSSHKLHMMVRIFALAIFILTATAMPMPSTPEEDLGCGVNIRELNPSKSNATNLSPREDDPNSHPLD
jgi:hypothetical protein